MHHCRIATPNDIETIANLHALSWQNSYRGMLSDDYLDNHVLADRIQVWTQKINEPPAHQIIFLKEIKLEVMSSRVVNVIIPLMSELHSIKPL